MKRAAAAVAVLLVASALLRAQQDAPATFEVAAIKQNKSGDPTEDSD